MVAASKLVRKNIVILVTVAHLTPRSGRHSHDHGGGMGGWAIIYRLALNGAMHGAFGNKNPAKAGFLLPYRKAD